MSVKRDPPVTDTVLGAFDRPGSTIEVRRTEWADGRLGATIAFSARHGGEPRWTYIVLRPNEVRAVAGRLLDLADAEGWK